MTDLIRIPHRFYQDHQERDLPTPAVVRSTKAHLFIRRDDPALAELLEDAQHYSEANLDIDIGLLMSARATARAIKGA